VSPSEFELYLKAARTAKVTAFKLVTGDGAVLEAALAPDFDGLSPEARAMDFGDPAAGAWKLTTPVPEYPRQLDLTPPDMVETPYPEG
jgi:hypothetical protein